MNIRKGSVRCTFLTVAVELRNWVNAAVWGAALLSSEVLTHQRMWGLSGRIVGRSKKAADIARVEIGLRALQVPI